MIRKESMMPKESARDDFAGMTSQLEIKKDEINDCSFTSDGKRALTGAQGGPVQLWDVETGRCLFAFEDNSIGAWGLRLSDDGRRALFGARDKTLQLWDVNTGRRLRSLAGHTGFVRCVDFSSDLRLALSGSGVRDHAVRLWDVETERCLRLLEGHTDGVYDVAFDAAQKRALSGSRDGTVRLFVVETLAKLAETLKREEAC